MVLIITVIYCLIATVSVSFGQDFSPITVDIDSVDYDDYLDINIDQNQEKKSVTIAFVLDGPSFVNDKLLSIFETEINELLKNEFKVQFPANKVLIGNWTSVNIKQQIQRLMNDDDTDIIITLGYLSSSCALSFNSYSKPVIVPFIFKTNEKLSPERNITKGGKIFEEGQKVSWIKNLNYLKFEQLKEHDLDVFQKIIPFKHLSILINENVYNEIPDLKEIILNELAHFNFELDIIPVGNDIDFSLSKINKESDAVYVGPVLNLSEEQFRYLAESLIEKKLPSFSYHGEKDVERGILATNTPFYNYKRIARQTAINIQRILLGEDASNIPVNYELATRLIINGKTASKINYYPDWRIRTEADFISEEEPDTDRILSLDSVIKESIKDNLAVKAKRFDIITSSKSIKEAKTSFLPQADIIMGWVKLSGGIRDESMGYISPHTLFTSVTLQQLLYSDKAFANVKIKKFLHEREKERQKTLELDIASKTATIYLDLIKAKNLLKIQRNNIEISRYNLELAEARKIVGTSGPADVYRWKAQIAKNKKDVIDAETNLSIQKVILNRLLNQPQDELFITEESGINDPMLLSQKQRLLEYLEDPQKNKKFVEFLIYKGLEESTEIKALDYVISAKKRETTSIKREFWTPNVNFQMNYSGFTQNDVSKTKGNLALGVMASLPIFQGGKRIVKFHKTKEELLQLEVQRDLLKEELESNIRMSLLKIGSTYPDIELSKDALVNTNKALDLVSDAYKQGTTSIIDLLDAQNAALVSDQLATNSIYDFIISMIQLQRTIGKVDFSINPEEWDQWFNELDKFSEYSE